MKFASLLGKIEDQRLNDKKIAQLTAKILCPLLKMLVFLPSVREELLHIGFFLYSKLSVVVEAGSVSVSHPTESAKRLPLIMANSEMRQGLWNPPTMKGFSSE